MVSKRDINRASLSFVTLELDGEWIMGVCTVHYWRQHLGFLRIEGWVDEFDTEAIWQYSTATKLEDAVFTGPKVTQFKALRVLFRQRSSTLILH